MTITYEAQARIAVVNGLRALAIVGVVWHHTAYKSWLPHAQTPLWEPLAALLSSGWLGVNLFFVLSGFVLYLPFARGNRDAGSKLEWIDFYKRRAIRLLPLFYLSLCTFAVLDLLAGEPALPVTDIAAYLTITFNFFSDTFFPRPNWILWSLGVEVWFSLLFPLLVVAIARHGINRVLLATLVLSLVVRFAGAQPDLFAPGDRLNPIKDGILGRLDDFVVGMWVCHAYVRQQLNSARMKWLMPLGATAGVLACVMWERVVADRASAVLVPLLHNGIQLGCGSLLAATLTTHRRWTALLTNWAMQLIGMMCFSIYVWHGRLIEILIPSFRVSAFGLYVVVLAIVAGLSYRFIEFPRVKPWQRLFLPMTVADHRR